MTTKRKKKLPLPRYWKAQIRKLTGLEFCDANCNCDEPNKQLWYWPPGLMSRGLPKWLPGWTNGVDTDELWDWLVENGHHEGTKVDVPDAVSADCRLL